MSDLDDPSLELLLREHFSAELDGQLGRPATAFLRHVGQGSPADGAVASEASFPRLSRLGSAGNFNNPRGRLNGWFIGLAGAALAASIAALWAAPAAFRRGAPVVPVRSVRPLASDRPDTVIAKADEPGTIIPGDPAEWNPSHLAPPSSGQPTLHWVQSRAWDEGTVVLDDPEHGSDHLVPARKIRQQQWDHTQWYDPAQRARVEMTVPRQNVKLVEMDTY